MAQNKNIPPPAQFIDPATGYLTRAANNFLNSITRSSNEAAAGEVATPAGSGLEGGGQVSDGITLSIAPAGVTNAMLRDSQPFSVIGRYSSTAGSPADIVATANDRVLARIGDVLAFYPISAIPGVVADGDYGDITVSGTGTVWTIDANVVTDAKFRQSAALSVVGRSANSTGNVADIAGTASQFFGVNAAGTTLGFQTMAGDATLAGPTLTLATVNANTGTWGSATQSAAITLDAKGRATAASNVTITPAASSITGGQALTKTDDTNVTLTLGGAPTTALLSATSLTVGWSGQLAADRGGTGIASYAVGDLIYASGATTLSKLADVATGNALISGGVTTAPAWGKIGLTTHVSGVLPVANGGTNAGSASGTALDNITGFSSTGMMTRTGAGTYAFRTLTAGTGSNVGLTISNGDGVSGNPTIGIDSAMSTWTPTISSQTGAITTSTVNTARYKQLGNFVFIELDVTITNAGTGGGSLLFTLPVNAAVVNVLYGIEVVGTGNALASYITSATQAQVRTYNNGGVITTGNRCIISGFYEV